MEPAYHVTITHEGRTWEVVVPAETPGQAEEKARARYGILEGRVQARPRLRACLSGAVWLIPI